MKERFKVLQKLIDLGYNTDKKIINVKIEDLLQLNNITRSDLIIIIGIRNSINNKNLIAFLCGIDEKKESLK